MKYKNKQKVNKYTLREQKRQKRENVMKGDGEYLFVNNTRGELTLEKKPIKSPNPSRPLIIGPNEIFTGDSYFLKLMQIGHVRLLQTLVPAQKEIMAEQKLIVDQPNRFTSQGQTEHVVPEDKNVKLVENQPNQAPVDKLITEDPLEGVEIILG